MSCDGVLDLCAAQMQKGYKWQESKRQEQKTRAKGERAKGKKVKGKGMKARKKAVSPEESQMAVRRET